MQTAAILWHVSLLVAPEHRAIALGLVGPGPAAARDPVLDRPAARWRTRGTAARVMLVTQCAAGVTALVLAALTFHGLSRPWPIYALAALGAVAGAFDGPARQAMLPTLVPREHLANAISLNAIMLQIASVAGPSIGGILIATLGVGWVYAVNAVSFGCVIAALLMMRDVPVRDAGQPAGGQPGRHPRRAALRLRQSDHPLHDAARFLRDVLFLRHRAAADLRAGHSARRRPRLRLAVRRAVGGRGADQPDHGPRDRADRPPRRRACCGAWPCTASPRCCSASRIFFWLTFLCLALTGAADTVSTVIRNVVRQLETPDHLRGRMIGVNMVFFMGGPQLGELEAGSVRAVDRRAAVGDHRRHRMPRRPPRGLRGATPPLRNYRRASVDAGEQGRLRSAVR